MRVAFEFDPGEEHWAELWSGFQKLNERTQREIASQGFTTLVSFVTLASECESPIEELMAVSLLVQADIFRMSGNELFVEAQQEIEINLPGQTVARVDFLVWAVKSDGEIVQVAVECDGHEFHERTKTQAARDKARDRAIQAQGIPVLRFTGSEIWKDANACAREVRAMMQGLVGIDG